MKVYRADQLENPEEAERPAGSDALENPVRDSLHKVSLAEPGGAVDKEGIV